MTIRDPGGASQSPTVVAPWMCRFIPSTEGRGGTVRTTTENAQPRDGRRNLAKWRGGTFPPPRTLDTWNRRKEGKRMTYDRLVCANCASPVNEGRCPVCRANRERLQQENFLAGLNPMALIALLTVLIAAVALLAHQTA